MSHVLLVGSVPARLRELRGAVVSGGYAFTVATSADEALDLIEVRLFDMILLDGDQPGCAHTRIEDLRTASNVPLVLLSGRVGERTTITMLEDGANQGSATPHRLAERLARKRTAMRRYEARRGPARNGRDNGGDPLTRFLSTYEGELVTTDDLADPTWSAMRNRSLPDLISAIRFRMKLQGRPFMILAEQNHAYRLIQPHPGRCPGMRQLNRMS